MLFTTTMVCATYNKALLEEKLPRNSDPPVQDPSKTPNPDSNYKICLIYPMLRVFHLANWLPILFVSFILLNLQCFLAGKGIGTHAVEANSRGFALGLYRITLCHVTLRPWFLLPYLFWKLCFVIFYLFWSAFIIIYMQTNRQCLLDVPNSVFAQDNLWFHVARFVICFGVHYAIFCFFLYAYFEYRKDEQPSSNDFGDNLDRNRSSSYV